MGGETDHPSADEGGLWPRSRGGGTPSFVEGVRKSCTLPEGKSPGTEKNVLKEGSPPSYIVIEPSSITSFKGGGERPTHTQRLRLRGKRWNQWDGSSRGKVFFRI